MSEEDLNVMGMGNFSVLTPEAMTELNAVIRNEKKARREVWESWAKIAGALVASLTGIIGGIIGLVAIWKK
jgi:flagellar motor component MotA